MKRLQGYGKSLPAARGQVDDLGSTADIRTNFRYQRSRIAAVCGIIAPIIWTILVLIAASLRPGYNHLIQYISELGFGPNSIIQNSNFLIVGTLIVVFAVGLHWGIRNINGFTTRVGPALVVVIGVGIIGAGLFPGDPSLPFSYSLHMLFSLPVFGLGPFAPIFMWRRMSKDSPWHGYRYYSVATGVLMFAAFSPPLLGSLPGLAQRLFLLILFAWIEVMAIKLLLLATRSSPTKPSSR